MPYNFYDFENRTDRLRPLADFAFSLLQKSISCEYKIIISTLVIDELEFNGYSSNIKDLIGNLKEVDKLLFVKEMHEDEEKAFKVRKERNTSLNDTKHAILANRSKASFFVTRNMNDFDRLQDMIDLRYPENL